MNNGIKKITQDIFCSGAYLFKDWETYLRSISFEKLCDFKPSEDSAFPYDNAHDFQMGSCELFALALHRKFRYEVYEIVQNGNMIHTFCIAYNKGHKIYIDVRGMTSSFDIFMAGVEQVAIKPLNADYCIRLRNIKEDEDLNEEWAKEGLRFANSIINMYPEYYTF